MRARLPVLVLVLGLAATACRALPPPPGEEAEGDRAAGDEVGTPATPPRDCPVLTSAEGAPAPLTMKDTFFDPICIALSSTQEVVLDNAGDEVHNFTIPDAGLDVDVQPGDRITTDAIGEFVQAGTHRFVCKYFEDEGMVGTIVVE